MPSITKPMWATDENAISRFMSRLREATQRAVDDADHREQPDPRRPRLAPPPGRIGSAMRMKP